MFIVTKQKYYNFSLYTSNSQFAFIDLVYDDIRSIINKLDPNKAHGHDNISIRMIKLRGDSIYKPVEMIFKSF